MQTDYIMRMIEEITRALLAIRSYRENGELKKARELVRVSIGNLLKVDLELLFLYEDEHIFDCFKNGDQPDMERRLLGADLFLELALIEEVEN